MNGPGATCRVSPRPNGKNPLDGNRIPAGQPGAGYPCFGQVGWATNVNGVFKPSPCYAWNNTFNGEKLRMETSRRADANEAATIKEGRDFFNEKPPQEYYKPYIYPHPNDCNATHLDSCGLLLKNLQFWNERLAVPIRGKLGYPGSLPTSSLSQVASTKRKPLIECRSWPMPFKTPVAIIPTSSTTAATPTPFMCAAAGWLTSCWRNREFLSRNRIELPAGPAAPQGLADRLPRRRVHHPRLPSRRLPERGLQSRGHRVPQSRRRPGTVAAQHAAFRRSSPSMTLLANPRGRNPGCRRAARRAAGRASARPSSAAGADCAASWPRSRWP